MVRSFISKKAAESKSIKQSDKFELKKKVVSRSAKSVTNLLDVPKGITEEELQVLEMLDEYRTIPNTNYRYSTPKYRGRSDVPTVVLEQVSEIEERARREVKQAQKQIQKIQKDIEQEIQQNSVTGQEKLAVILARMDQMEKREQTLEAQVNALIGERERFSVIISHMEQMEEMQRALEVQVSALQSENLLLAQGMEATQEELLCRLKEENAAFAQKVAKDYSALAKEMDKRQVELREFCFKKLGVLDVDMENLNIRNEEMMAVCARIEKAHALVIKENEKIVAEQAKLATKGIKKSELEDIRRAQEFYEEKMARKYEKENAEFINKGDLEKFAKQMEYFKKAMDERFNDLEEYSASELARLFRNEDAIRAHYQEILDALHLEKKKASLEPHSIYNYGEDGDESNGKANDAKKGRNNKGPNRPILKLEDGDLAKLARMPAPKGKKSDDMEDLSFNDKRFEEALGKSFSSDMLHKYWNSADKH